MSRRRIAVMALAALLLPCGARAMGIEKGIKAGVNLASFRGEFADIADAGIRTGFVGGGFVAFGFAPDLAVQVEALFSQKGAKFVSEATDEEGNPLGEFDTFVKLNYLEVPVLLRGTLLRGSPVQPMYFIGPTAGISLGGTVETDLAGVRDQDLDDLKGLDLGIALGAGAGFELGGRKVTAEFRYTSGFTDIYDIAGNAESINSVFSFMAGIAF